MATNDFPASVTRYRNKKTGCIYLKLANATDCTNERDGLGVIVYCPCDNEHNIFVRDSAEFFEKFELAETVEADGPSLTCAACGKETNSLKPFCKDCE